MGQHFTKYNKRDKLLPNQPIECVSETESEFKGALKSHDICLFSGRHSTNHFFKYNTIVLFEINYFMIFK